MGIIRDACVGTFVFWLVAVGGGAGALAGDVGFWHGLRKRVRISTTGASAGCLWGRAETEGCGADAECRCGCGAMRVGQVLVGDGKRKDAWDESGFRDGEVSEQGIGDGEEGEDG